MTAYYNEIDPYAAQWLRNLISAGHIAPGDVDERDIRDVHPDDLRRYRQCHFFAGIGVWSYGLRLAGWPDDRPIWTGSCPCQPFSAAGKGGGFDDERHLWPAFHHLIRECRPAVVLGEQVASKDGLAWLDLVQTDLEGTGYASAAVDLCAAGVGAPHIRQRLWWVGERLADSQCIGRTWVFGTGCADMGSGPDSERPQSGSRSGVENDGLADAYDAGLEGRLGVLERAAELAAGPGSLAGGLADATGSGRAARLGHVSSSRYELHDEGRGEIDRSRRPSQIDGFWRNADWLFCRDGKWRPVEPGTSPLAHGAPARVGYVCAACVQANSKSANNEDLRAVREIARPASGGLEKEILQQDLHGRSLYENAINERSRAVSGPALVRSENLRRMRQTGALPAPASYRPRPDEQRCGEHLDILLEMPRGGTHVAPHCEICGAEADWLGEASFAGNRVGRLRAYGNAIVAQAAAAFVTAYVEASMTL